MPSRRWVLTRLAPLVLGGTGLLARQLPPAGRVLPGIDVLRAGGFNRIRGRRVALLTNLAARTGDGQLTVDVIRGGAGYQLASLFAPEHGLDATQDTEVASSRDARTGLQVHSLYGEVQRPTPEMLRGLDLILVDLPDVGARFYTYMTTMGYVMEEAAKSGVGVMVLDRPNPVNGVAVEGPLLASSLRSHVGYHEMPVRHGLTLGELAQVFNGERGIGAAVSVVAASGWRRDMWFDQTALPWNNPSPNIRNLRAATLYPGIGAIEWSNISVGRGTPSPFEHVGAPWVDAPRLAAALNARQVPGLRFAATAFTPDSSVHARQRCGGVSLEITDRSVLRPVRAGIEIAAALWRQHPDRFDFGRTAQLLGSPEPIERIRNGEDPSAIASRWGADEARWRERSAKYLLY